MTVLLPYHSDIPPDAQGECNIYPQPGSALDEILQGQCKTLEILLGRVTRKESELYTVQNLVTVGHIPAVETAKL